MEKDLGRQQRGRAGQIRGRAQLQHRRGQADVQRGHRGQHRPRGNAGQVRHYLARGGRAAHRGPGRHTRRPRLRRAGDRHAAEDIHSFVEAELTARLGDVGKKLHTARSRNDQVALDTRLYLRDECEETVALIKDVISALCHVAEANQDTIMPGYTHLQRAQPVTFRAPSAGLRHDARARHLPHRRRGGAHERLSARRGGPRRARRTPSTAP